MTSPDTRCQPKGIAALAHYVAMRTAMPMNTLGDSVHAIHLATEYEAELHFSDIVATVNSHATLKARVEELEANERAYEAALGQRTYNEVAAHIGELEAALRDAKEFADDEFSYCSDLNRKNRISRLCDKIDAALNREAGQ